MLAVEAAQRQESATHGGRGSCALASVSRVRGIALKWCDNEKPGKPHLAPFFTITVSAMEVGPSTGRNGYKRISTRQIVSRLCSDCLLEAVIRLEGSKLISDEAQDRANG